MYENYGYGSQPMMQQMQPRQDWQQRLQARSAPRYEVIQVNGENGARAFQMAPNSSVLLMDTSAPIVWLCTTDGAGYMTANPFAITPYKPEPPVDVSELQRRIERLEGRLNEQSDAEPAKQRRARRAAEPDADAGE